MKKLILVIFLLLFGTHSFGAQKKYLLSKFLYDKIATAQKSIDKEEYQKAQEFLSDVASSSEIKSKVDKAYLAFYIGYIYSLQQQHQKAIVYFNKALEGAHLDPKQLLNIRLNLVQQYAVLENYYKVVDELTVLIKEDSSKYDYYIYRANANLMLKNFEGVIKDIKVAIQLHKSTKVEWLKMQFYAYYELKNYKGAVASLMELIKYEPTNKEYWIQLASLYTVTDDINRAAVSLQLANLLDIKLNKNETLQLAVFLRDLRVPFYSARLLEKSLESGILEKSEKNLLLVGDIYYEAKENTKALHFYTLSADKQKSAKIYYKVAKIHALEYDYKSAVKYLLLSLKNSDDDLRSEKMLLLGKAYYETGYQDKAKRVFRELVSSKKYGKYAQAWIEYMNN